MYITKKQIHGIKLVHNGYDIKYFDNFKEVELYIKSVLEPHLHLDPKKVFDRVINKKESLGEYTVLIRYRYRTLYEENFLIDVNTR